MALPMQSNLSPLEPTQQLGNQQSGFLQGLKNFLVGSPASVQRFTNYTPFQQSGLNALTSLGLENIQNPYQGFEPIAQRATSQFNQQIVPGLAERFTSLGSNRISSPSFASQLGQAGSGLQEGLAALQSQYGLQNRAQSLRELGLGLTPQYQSIQAPGSQGLLGSLLPLLANLGIAGTGALATGGGLQALIGLLGAMGGQERGWDLFSNAINKG